MKSFTFYFAAPLSVLLLSVTAVDAQVFSNEIHYDNVGADVNERIEVAGPTGTSLSGWSIVLYNGDGCGCVAGSANLSGTLPNSCTVSGQNIGVAVVTFGTNIQNGIEGWALVNSGTVVEFLSYEGTFVAVDGPAVGMTSTNIGAFEDGSGTADGSIQRTGLTTWVTSASSNTFGACNSTQLAALPIQLMSFSASNTSDGIKLSWTTASETQNDHFLIERSGDRVNFIAIGEKDGSGTTSLKSTYSFTDEQPLDGNNYYRLKQVDEDGSSTYSPVRMVRWGKSNEIAVYPNPASSGNINVNFTSTFEGTLQVSLRNAAGVEVHSQIVNVYKGENFIPVSSVNIPDGPYWIVATTDAATRVVPIQVKTN